MAELEYIKASIARLQESVYLQTGYDRDGVYSLPPEFNAVNINRLDKDIIKYGFDLIWEDAIKEDERRYGAFNAMVDVYTHVPREMGPTESHYKQHGCYPWEER